MITRGGNYTVQSMSNDAETLPLGKMSNFLMQAAQAREQGCRAWQALLDQGYVEFAPGMLRSPDGKTEVAL